MLFTVIQTKGPTTPWSVSFEKDHFGKSLSPTVPCATNAGDSIEHWFPKVVDSHVKVMGGVAVVFFVKLAITSPI